ncbi:MAG: cutinase family protein [Aeromicrobium sp.]
MIARITCALLGLVVVAGCGGSARSAGPDEPPRPLAGATCADVVVLGVRGSGQAADQNLGVGKEVLRTVTDLARRVERRDGTSMRLDAVRYDASGTATGSTYFEHVSAGARLLGRQARDLVAQCPGSRLAVVGFSQGADVVHEFADDVRPALARRIALVGMIADPRRNPADSIHQWSYAPDPVPHPGLLGAGAPVDADVRAVAISFCVKGDEVCSGGGVVGERTSATHRFFYEKPATAAITAQQLDRVLQAGGA